MHAMEQGSREVEIGVEKTSASGIALQEIIRLSEHVGEMISHIAAAATEQASASDEINGSVARIAESAQESSSAAAETATACTDLSQVAFSLQNLVNRFQLEAHPASIQSLPRNGFGSQKGLSGKRTARAVAGKK